MGICYRDVAIRARRDELNLTESKQSLDQPKKPSRRSAKENVGFRDAIELKREDIHKPNESSTVASIFPVTSRFSSLEKFYFGIVGSYDGTLRNVDRPRWDSLFGKTTISAVELWIDEGVS
jgi:hypothetical protein